MMYKFKVLGGTAFIYQSHIKDHDGVDHPFAPLPPAPGGSVIDLEDLQTRGQLHKLEMADSATFECSFKGCPSGGQPITTTVPSAILDGQCPYCGNRSLGAVMESVGVKDRMDRTEINERIEDAMSAMVVEEVIEAGLKKKRNWREWEQ